jgi:hypothetical protein
MFEEQPDCLVFFWQAQRITVCSRCGQRRWQDVSDGGPTTLHKVSPLTLGRNTVRNGIR